MKSTKITALVAILLPLLGSGCGSSKDVRLLDETKTKFDGTCSNDSQCPSGEKCVTNTDMHICLPGHCFDHVKNDGETDIDCGVACGPAYLCIPGQTCTVPGDCTSNICTNGNCVGLPDGSLCTNANQCASRSCVNGTCSGTTPCPGGCPSGQVCGSNNNCVPQQTGCNPACTGGLVCSNGTCITPGNTPPTQSCTLDSQCAPAVCLTTTSPRVCSFYPFGFTVTATAQVRCYAGTAGSFVREFTASPNTSYTSNPAANETSCVAVGLASNQASETTFANGSCACSGTLNPGSATCTWSCH